MDKLVEGKNQQHPHLVAQHANMDSVSQNLTELSHIVASHKRDHNARQCSCSPQGKPINPTSIAETTNHKLNHDRQTKCDADKENLGINWKLDVWNELQKKVYDAHLLIAEALRIYG